MSVKKIIKKIRTKKFLKQAFLILLIIIFSFIIADIAMAKPNIFVRIVGGFISAIVYILGWILMLVVRVLVYVAQYNNFIHAEPIVVGWIMTRDLANMFFIVILLIIAFATILRIEKYNYKKWLPKLLLMAVLINFSKTICGILIDVAQIVMLSFVNSFKGVGGYNFTTMLGIGSFGQFRDIEATDSNWDILAAYGLMLIYTVISLVVMIAMTAMLMMRIIMIWVYVVLSPLAFLLGAFPDGQSYASKWWSQFGQNLIIGPVLAFFIWLSFMTVQPGSEGYQILEQGKDGRQTTSSPLSGKVDGHDVTIATTTPGVGNVGQADTLLRFIIAIAMLIGGLKVSQEIGGAAGGVLGKVSSKGFAISKQLGKKAAIGSAKLTGRKSLGAYATISEKAEKMGIIKKGKSLPGAQFARKWREDIKSSRTKKRVENRAAFLQKMGIGEQAGDHLATTLKTKYNNKRFNITQQAAEKISSDPKVGREFNKRISSENGVEEINNMSADSIHLKDSEYTGTQKAKSKAMVNDLNSLGNIEKWLNDSDNGYYGDEGDKKKVDAFIRSIEAVDKAGDISSTTKDKAMQLKTQLESKRSEETKPYSREGQKQKDTRDEEQKNLLQDIRDIMQQATGGGQANPPASPPPPNYRLSNNANQTGAVGKGGLEISSFGGKNKEDLIGLDFSKLPEHFNFRVDALGANINKEQHGSLMQEMARNLIDQISYSQLSVDSEKENLDKKYEKKEISKEDYQKEQKTLDHKKAYLSQAKQRLKNGDYEALNLVNTAHPENDRKERLISSYHEKIHTAGIDDEYITESIAKSLMTNQLYGRNKETGKRHVVEVAQMAKQMQDEGLDESEIVDNINKEIKNRSAQESSSRADRILKKEKGILPTEGQELADLEKKDYSKMNKEELLIERGVIENNLQKAEKTKNEKDYLRYEAQLKELSAIMEPDKDKNVQEEKEQENSVVKNEAEKKENKSKKTFYSPELSFNTADKNKSDKQEVINKYANLNKDELFKARDKALKEIQSAEQQKNESVVLEKEIEIRLIDSQLNKKMKKNRYGGNVSNDLLKEKEDLEKSIKELKKRKRGDSMFVSEGLARNRNEELKKLKDSLSEVNQKILNEQRDGRKHEINPQSNKRSYNPEAAFNTKNQSADSPQINKSEPSSPLKSSASNQAIELEFINKKEEKPKVVVDEKKEQEAKEFVEKFKSSLVGYIQNTKNADLGDFHPTISSDSGLYRKINRAILDGNANVSRSLKHFINSNDANSKRIALAALYQNFEDIESSKKKILDK